MKFYLFVVISFHLFEGNSSFHKSFESIELREPIFIPEIVSNYLLKYFSREQVFLSFALSSMKVGQKFIQENIINELITNTKLGNFSYNVLNKVDQSNGGNKKVFNLILVDGGESLIKILNDSTVQPFHLNQKFLIVVTQSVQKVEETLHDLFAIILNVGLISVNILIENGSSAIWSLYYYVPYSRSCNSFSVIRIESFSRENYTCQMDISIKNLFPPVHEPISDSSRIKYDGIDVILVNQISRTLNLIPKYIQSPEANKRGIIFKNGTATGAFGMVIEGAANMTIGTHALSSDRVKSLSYSHSYIQHSFIFAYAENNVYESSLARLLAPFQIWVWLSMLLLVKVSIFIILMTKKLSRHRRHFIIGGYLNRTPILNMMNGLIGNVIPNRRMTEREYFSNFARMLTVLWILFWLILRNAYQGSLYEHFQSHRSISPYDTVEKVRNSNISIHLLTTGAAFIPEGFDCRRLLKNDNDIFTSIKNILTGKWNGVLLNNDVTVNYFNFISKSPHEVKYTRDKIRLQNPVFYFRKNSFLTRLFNKKIETCRESGLIRHWLAQYQSKRHKIEHKEPMKLGIPNILAIVQISIAMYLISLIAFVLEILSPGHGIIRTVMDYLTY